MLLDVTFSGYKLVPLESFLAKGNEIVYSVAIQHDTSRGVKKVGRWLNRPYNYKGLLSFVGTLDRLFKKTLLDPTENPNSLICSEMVVILLQNSGYPKASTLIASTTSPKQLYDFLVAN
jgi:hypothetical protein